MNTETDTINPRNFTLCEAAPDLLEALEAITSHAVQFLDFGQVGGKELDILNAANAAIRKAKGDK